MNTLNAIELRSALLGEQRLPETAPPAPERAFHRPWFVSLVLGFCGWLAGFFVVLFVGMLFEPRNFGDWLVAGLISFGAAFGLYSVDKENTFLDQLALALSITGQVAFTACVIDMTKSVGTICAWVALMQMALLAFMPNRFAKVLATVFAVIAWSLSIRFAWWEQGPWDTIRSVALLPAFAAWVFIWAPVGAIATILIEREHEWMATRYRDIARPALIGLIVALSFGTYASQPLIAFQVFMRDGVHAANWLALWPLLSVAASVWSLILALRVRSNALAAAAIVAMLLHIGHFYYVFGTTLIVKSIIMIVLGAVLLLLARTSGKIKGAK